MRRIRARASALYRARASRWRPRGGARRGARRSRGRSAHIARQHPARQPPSPPLSQARCARALTRAARTCACRARRRAARRTARGVGDPEVEVVAERADHGKTRVHRPSAPVSASEPGALRTSACACCAAARQRAEANRCRSRRRAVRRTALRRVTVVARRRHCRSAVEVHCTRTHSLHPNPRCAFAPP